jgi:four helix bundle protein
MGGINNFQELKVWQKAHELVLFVYKITENFPKSELFCLTSQMCRAAISVAANIVEGFRRRSMKDSLHFYNIANASLEELKYYFILSKDLKYINETVYQQILNLSEEVSKMLNGWIKSQQNFS